MQSDQKHLLVRHIVWFLLCAGCLAELVALPVQAAPTIRYIVYPRFEERSETRYPPYVELLQKALDRTSAQYGPAKLQPSRLPMNSSRASLELQRGAIDVIWNVATEEHERELLPVRIPIEKGLLGYRIALISQERQAAIDQVRKLADLRKLTIGQGLGWGDIELYRFNGIPVAAANYTSLFSMVTSGRFDLFPRGVGEVFAEYDAYASRHPKLAIEQHLALYYPWPYYFFFNRKTGTPLATRVEQGLRQMIRDGSFDTWFQEHYGTAIRRANLAKRRIIRLENPLLPKDTPLNDASLWYTPAATPAQ